MYDSFKNHMSYLFCYVNSFKYFLFYFINYVNKIIRILQIFLILVKLIRDTYRVQNEDLFTLRNFYGKKCDIYCKIYKSLHLTDLAKFLLYYLLLRYEQTRWNWLDVTQLIQM